MQEESRVRECLCCFFPCLLGNEVSSRHVLLILPHLRIPEFQRLEVLRLGLLESISVSLSDLVVIGMIL